MVINNISNYDFLNIGPVEEIYFVVDKDMANAITKAVIVFSSISLAITVNNDEDTIIISDNNVNNNNINNAYDLYRIEKLNNMLCSKTLLWIWELTNQQGYTDGIQIEFTNKRNIEQKNVIIQFIAIASTIQINVVEQLTG